MRLSIRKSGMLRCLGVIFLLIPFLASCSDGGQTSKSTPSPTPSVRLAAMTPDSLNLVYEDDFSASRWYVASDENSTSQYQDGQYRMSVNAPLVIRNASPFPTQSDSVIEVQAKLVSSGSNSGYGIAFRENDGNYYYFRISGNRYKVNKFFQNKWDTLHSDAKSDYIKTDGSPNQLKVACLGDSIEVSINGQWLATIKDSSFSEGRIALVAEGKDTAVTFDNFKMYNFTDAYLQKAAPQLLEARKAIVASPSPTTAPTPTGTATFEQKRADVLKYLKSYNSIKNGFDDALAIIPSPEFNGQPQDLPALKVFASQTGVAATGAISRLKELKTSPFEPETTRLQERTLAYLQSIQKLADSMNAAAASGDSRGATALLKGFDSSEGVALDRAEEELQLKYNISDAEVGYRRQPPQKQTDAPASTSRQYTNTEWGYSVQLPPGWDVINDSNKALVTLRFESAGVLIGASTTFAGVEVNLYLDSVLSSLRSAYPDFQELSRNKVILAGNVPAMSLAVKYTSKDQKEPHTEFRLIAATADRGIHIVGFINEPDTSWFKYLSQYETIANSLVITAMPPKKATPTATPSTGQPSKGTMNLGPRVQVTANDTDGTIAVQKSGDPLDGFNIQVPAGAYQNNPTFEVSYQPVQSHTFGPDVTPISPVITVQTAGGVLAKKPILVKIPVKVPPDSFAMAFFYDSKTGKLEGVPFVTQDSDSVTVATSRFGDFVVLSALHTTIMTRFLAESAPGSGFEPGKDDWQFVNEGSYLSPGGFCQGSSLSELWYYDEVVKKTPNAKRLWNLYDNNKSKPTPNFWHDDSLAYRLASVVQEDSSAVRSLSISTERYFDDQVFYAFVVSMYLTGEPQFVGIEGKDREGNTSGHAIVAYKIAKDRIYVADPNFPGNKERSIPFNGVKFLPYSSGDNAKVIGVNDVRYNKFYYFGKTALMDWGALAALWKQVDAGTIGNGRFPDYKLTLVDDTGKTYDATAKDLAVTTKKMAIQITSQAPLNLGLYREGNWVDKGDTNPTAKLKLDIELKDGVNDLGIYVTGDARKQPIQPGSKPDWEYVDFKWVSVTLKPPSVAVTITSATATVKNYTNRNGSYGDLTVVASGTASGPVGAMVSFKYDLISPRIGLVPQDGRATLTSGWTVISDPYYGQSKSQRKAGEPESISWTYTGTGVNMAADAYPGCDTELTVTIFIPNSNEPPVKKTMRLKPN